MRATLTSSLLLMLTPLVALPGQSGRATTSPAITVADLKQRLYAIADDSMQGRSTGSLGDFKAAGREPRPSARARPPEDRSPCAVRAVAGAPGTRRTTFPIERGMPW